MHFLFLLSFYCHLFTHLGTNLCTFFPKVWLDNMCMATAVLSAAVHVVLTRMGPTWRLVKRPKRPTKHHQSEGVIVQANGDGFLGPLAATALSGAVYGGLCLNTKLTNLALLPFLLAWSVVEYCATQSDSGQDLGLSADSGPARGTRSKTSRVSRASASRVDCSPAPHRSRSFTGLSPSSSPSPSPFAAKPKWFYALMIMTSFLAGTALTALPWLAHYRQQRGRWLPSAWPSKALLERFPFVLAATRRPALTFYLQSLAALSPLVLAGLLLAVLLQLHLLLCLLRYRAPGLLALRVAALALWPLGFWAGHVVLGLLGAGCQMRFLLPCVPPCAVLVAMGVAAAIYCSPIRDDLLGVGVGVGVGVSPGTPDGHQAVPAEKAQAEAQNPRPFPSRSFAFLRFFCHLRTELAVIALLLLVVAAAHCWYLGVLLAPHLADLSAGTSREPLCRIRR
jgi:hypothetical protein